MVTRALDPETYATIVARIAAGEDRDVVLAAQGYDDETFDRAEEAFHAMLSDEMLVETDDAAPPPSLVAFDHALRASTRAAGVALLTIERYAQAMSILERGDRIDHRLSQAGLTLPEVFAATAHYAPRLAREPDLAAAFQQHKKRVRGNDGRGSSGR